MNDILALLTRPAPQFKTVVLQCTAEYDTAALERARESSELRAPAPEHTARIKLDAPLAVHSRAVADNAEFVRHHWSVWWRPPDCWRDDIVWDTGHMAISIACGPVSSSFLSALHTMHTNARMKGKIPWLRRKPGPRDFPYLPTVRDRLAQMPLVDATALATGWQLAVLGNANHAGRPALRVRATRIDASAPFGLWQYVDDYEVLVDETYGVLLRCAAVVGGEEAAVLSVQVAQFNEPIPDDIFAFEPPVGTRVLTQG